MTKKREKGKLRTEKTREKKTPHTKSQNSVTARWCWSMYAHTYIVKLNQEHNNKGREITVQAEREREKKGRRKEPFSQRKYAKKNT